MIRAPGRNSSHLALEFSLSEAALQAPIDRLLADGRIQRDAEGNLRAWGFHVPVGAEHGWESAVFDHFQAVAIAIATSSLLLNNPQMSIPAAVYSLLMFVTGSVAIWLFRGTRWREEVRGTRYEVRMTNDE